MMNHAIKMKKEVTVKRKKQITILVKTFAEIHHRFGWFWG